MTKSKKYQGVYYQKKKDGDLTYYFTYQYENENDNKSQKLMFYLLIRDVGFAFLYLGFLFLDLF